MQGGPKKPGDDDKPKADGSEAVLKANAPAPKPAPDPFAKAFAELEKQKAKGDDANQDQVKQIEKELKKIQSSDDKPKHKEAKMMSYLKEEARDGKQVAMDVLKSVDAKVAKEVVPKTVAEKASEKHGLNDLQKQKLEEFSKEGSKLLGTGFGDRALGSDHQAKQAKYSKYADEANTQSYKDIYKKDMKNSLKQFRNAFENQEVAKDENEAFAQLMRLLMEMLAFLFSPLSNLGNAAGEKAKNAIKEKFWDVMSTMQGNKFNDPSTQKGVLKGLEKDRDKTESNIAKLKDSQLKHEEGSREHTKIGNQIKFYEAKLDVVNNALDKTKSHLCDVQDKDLQERKQNLTEKKTKLEGKGQLSESDKEKAKSINQEIGNIERQQAARKANPSEPLMNRSPERVEKQLDGLLKKHDAIDKKIEKLKDKKSKQDPDSKEAKAFDQRIKLQEARQDAIGKKIEAKGQEFKASSKEEAIQIAQNKPAKNDGLEAHLIHEELAKQHVERAQRVNDKMADFNTKPKPENQVTLGTPKPETTKEASLDEPKGNKTKADSTSTTTAATTEPVLSATTPDKPKPKEDAFSKAFAELDKQKAKGDDVNQDHVKQIEKELKKIQDSDDKPKHKEAKMKSYLVEETRNNIAVAKDVLTAVDADVAKKVVPKTAVEMASEKHNLTEDNKARLEERQKKTTGFFRGDDHAGKQKKMEEKADAANTQSFGDIYKKDMKNSFKQFKNTFANAETPKDEYEAFAQLMRMIMEAIAFLLSPLSNVANAAGEKAKNAIKEQFYEQLAKHQGNKHNDPSVQKGLLKGLDKDIDKTEKNIYNLQKRQCNHKEGSRKYNQLENEINYNKAKLDILKDTQKRTDSHLKNLQKMDLDKREKVLNDKQQKLEKKLADDPGNKELEAKLKANTNALQNVRDDKAALAKNGSKALRVPKPDSAEKQLAKLEKREGKLADKIAERQQKLDKPGIDAKTKDVLQKKQALTQKRLQDTQKAVEDKAYQYQASLEKEKKLLDQQKPEKNAGLEAHLIYDDAVKENAERLAGNKQKLIDIEAKKQQKSPTDDQQVTLGAPKPEVAALNEPAGNKPSPTASGPTSPGTGSDAEAERIRRERDEADKRTEAENARLQATAAENDAASQRVTEAQNAANKTHDDLQKAKKEGNELEKERDKKSEAVNDAQTEKDKADKALEADKNNPTLKNDAESAKKKLDDAQNELNDANKKLEDNKKEVDRLKEADDKAQQNVQDVQKQNDADYAKNATGANATATATPTAANKSEDDTQAKIKIDEDKRKADEEAQRQAEEDARLQAEEEAKLQAEEEAKLQANEQAELQAEENNQLTQSAQSAAVTAENDDEANKNKESERIEQDEEQGAELSTADQIDDDNDPNSPAAERKRAANQGAVTASPTDDAANDQEQAQSLGASGGASANDDENEEVAAEADQQADNDEEASADADEEVDNDAQLQQGLDQGNDNDGLAAQADSPAPTTPTNDVDSQSPAALTQDDDQETELTQGSDQEASNDDTPAPVAASDDEESELKQGMEKGSDEEEEPEEPQADASASVDEEEEQEESMTMESPMSEDSTASASPVGGGESPAAESPMSSMSASPVGGGESPAAESPMSSMSASPMGGSGGGSSEEGEKEEVVSDEQKQMAMQAGAAAVGVPGGEMAAGGGATPDMGGGTPSPGGGGGGSNPLSGGGEQEAPKKEGSEEKKDDKKSSKGGKEETEDNSEYGAVSKVMAETVKMITDVLNEAVSNVIGGMGGGPGGGEDKKDGPKEGNGKSAPKKEGGGKGGKESKEGGDPSDAMGGAKEFTKGLVKLTGAIGSFAESMSDGKGADQTKAFEESLKMLSELFKGMGKVVKGGMEGGGMDGASPSGGGGKPGMDGASPGGGGKDKGGKEEKEPPSKNQQMATMAGDVGAQCMGIPPPASTMIGQAVGEAVGKIEKAMDIGKGFADFCNTLAEGCNVTSSKPNPGDVAMQKAESDSAAVLPAATKSLGETPGLKEQAKSPGAGAGADAGAAPPSSTPPPTPSKSP